MNQLALGPDVVRYFATQFGDGASDQAALLLGAYLRALVQLGAEAAGSAASVVRAIDRVFGYSHPMRIAWCPEAGLLEAALVRSDAPASLRPLLKALTDTGRAARGPSVLFDGRSIRLRLAGSKPPYPLPGGWSAADVDPEAVVAQLELARDLIAASHPRALRWVADAVAEIALLDGATGTRFSATCQEYPGLVYLSLPLTPYEIAARLVHEASHQYYFALERLTPLHDGSDRELYHSPIKGRGRPIEAILFSFHAFGNGVLFDRRHCDDRPGAPDAATRAANEEGLVLMARHLETTRALTPAGRDLWRQLAGQLFD